MSRYSLFDRRGVGLRPLVERGHDMGVANVAPLQTPAKCYSHSEFRVLIEAIWQARQRERPVIVMMGGHPIKLGLSRFVIDLMERRLVTHVATNGAGIVHDFELALVGGTSEDVAKWIKVGQFGLWQETSRLNDIICDGATRGEGLGEAVGRVMEEERFPHLELSIAAAGWRLGIPVTSHVTIGGDIIHSHPNCDGAALGATSFTDFLIIARSVQDLEGGVFLNVGSAVTGPEVYLKALSMARNVARHSNPQREQGRSEAGPPEALAHAAGYEEGSLADAAGYLKSVEPVTPCHFTTAVFDLIPLPANWRDGTPSKDDPFYYYRPWKTILTRTVADGGQSFYFQGDHRQTIPTLWHELVKHT